MEFPVSTGVKRAVDRVSLNIEHGERVGIIGRNGAGKTTILQIMAGLLSPTDGKLDVVGHVNCVMTLGVGLREELTGRQNIYVDGELNGKTRHEIDFLRDEIIAFTDIGEYIDRPVRTYSTGMKSRLAFALITFIEPDILIIDEALSAGDSEFSKKASQRMRALCDSGRIVILVSHSMTAIRDICTRCIWMEEGRVVMDGPSSEVTEAYSEAVRKTDEEEMRVRFQKRIGPRTYCAGYSVTKLEFIDRTGISRLVWQSNEEMGIRFIAETDSSVDKYDFKLSFERLDGNIILENWSRRDGLQPGLFKGKSVVEIDIGKLCFGSDTYQVTLGIYDVQTEEVPNLLASYSEVIKVEKPLGCLDSPAYFWPISLDAQKIMEK